LQRIHRKLPKKNFPNVVPSIGPSMLSQLSRQTEPKAGAGAKSSKKFFGKNGAMPARGLPAGACRGCRFARCRFSARPMALRPWRRWMMEGGALLAAAKVDDGRGRAPGCSHARRSRECARVGVRGRVLCAVCLYVRACVRASPVVAEGVWKLWDRFF